MDLAIQVCSYLFGLPLILLTIAAIFRSGPRSYPFAFAYVIALFLATVAELPTSLAYYARQGRTPEAMVYLYWIDEAILQLLIFAVVISLIYSATAKLGSRRLVRLALIAGAVLFVGVSFLAHYSPKGVIGLWMNPWSRDLKFCAAILDVLLWALLVGSRNKDYRLLLLSGGMGVMFAGEAIGESIRQLATTRRVHWMATSGGTLVIISDLLFLYIWWRAFRAVKNKAHVMA